MENSESNGSLIDSYHKMVQERVQAEKGTIPADSSDNESEKITSEFVRKCLQPDSGSLGHGTLFAVLHKGRFVFNSTSGRWLVWRHHHWETDYENQALAAVENVVNLYLNEMRAIAREIAAAVRDEKGSRVEKLRKFEREIIQIIKKIRTTRGREEVLQWASCNPVMQLCITGDRIDLQTYKLPCLNGVVELRNGKLFHGRPGDYLMKAAPPEYLGCDHCSPLFERFIDEIFCGDTALIKFVQRLFGYAISGVRQEAVFPLLVGVGRNGKSTLLEVFKHVLGPLAGPIPAELLLEQPGSRNSGAPSPDLMKLRGLRVAFALETDPDKKLSLSRVKWLSGGDTLVARNPHDKELTEFSPTHQLFLVTNHIPKADPSDFGFWERCVVVPFNLSFVDRMPQADHERQADKQLLEKLKREASGVLSWLVQGCIDWQQQGLNPPPVVREAVKDYRRGEDVLSDFIEEACYIDSDFKIQAKNVYDAFCAWYKEHISKWPLSNKTFARLMEKKFKKTVSDGRRYYVGLGLTANGEELLLLNDK